MDENEDMKQCNVKLLGNADGLGFSQSALSLLSLLSATGAVTGAVGSATGAATGAVTGAVGSATGAATGAATGDATGAEQPKRC